MVAALAAPGTATAVGYDADGFLSGQVSAAVATATGYAALGIPAASAAGTVPDALRLEILTADGTQLLNDLVARRNLSFTVEHNGSGSISFETDLENFTDGIDDPLLDPSNLVRVHLGDLPGWPYGVAEGFITSAPPVENDGGNWTLTVSCPGSWDVLDFGVIWPPSGTAGDTREFSYTAGMTGPSWVPDQWGTPVGKNVKDSFRWKEHGWPTGWPESKSEWLWSISPDKWNPVTAPIGAVLTGGETPAEIQHFVGSFTLATSKAVRFYFAGDDTISLYINSVKVKHEGRDAWHSTTKFTRTLPAGGYTIAAAVANVFGEDGKSGFLFAAATLKANGDVDQWVLRSSPDTFFIRKSAGYFAQVPLPPDGWYPAAVLWQHVGEAAVRGVDFYPEIALTFTDKVDSSGSAWTDKGPAEYEIGISGAELGEKIRDGGVDLAMLPGLRLSAWKRRGFDLRSRVVISTPLGVGWASRAWARVRTAALTHHETGWKETIGDLGVYGRRELSLSGGGVNGAAQADVFANAALTTAASPEETIEAIITSADLRAGAPQPFRDFDVADTVMFETIGGFQPVKVMSIRGDEQDTKEVRFTIAGYPV